MKALVLTQAKTIEIIDKPTPTPGKGEVLVKIKAAALNHRDQWIREGLYAGIQTGVTLGSDGAGVVEAAGEGVEKNQVGQEVIINPSLNWGNDPGAQSKDYKILGMPVDGTFAEYLVVPADRLQPKPQHLNWAEAASVPLAGLTAYRAIFTQGNVQAGTKVLVNGIGGGVAQWAFLFAYAAGAQVWVSSSSAEKISYATSNGAVGGFNYRQDDWAKRAREESGGFDVVIDSAGGNAFNKLLDAVKPGGSIIIYGATAGVPDQLNLRKVFWNQIKIQGSTMGNDQEFADMIRLIEKQKLRPVMEKPYAFQEIVKAFDTMKAGEQLGKLAVLMP